MTKRIDIRVIDRAGVETRISAEAGQTVLEALQQSGIDELSAQCGGNCSCATCHIYVKGHSNGAISPMSVDEDDLLEGANCRTQESRLSCQVVLEANLEDVIIRIAPE